jgi:ribosomal protein S18 acetylase RimI-like enzyme
VADAAGDVTLQFVSPGDVPAADALVANWGGAVARLGELVDTSALPVVVAYWDEEVVGALAYDIAHGECEVVTIEALHQGSGIGRALLLAVCDRARERECARVWLVTTNDNTVAIRFYQRQGMELCAVHLGAVDDARARLKPSIARVGADGIPIRHELVFERVL